MRLLRSIPTWLSSISPNSKFRTESNSTAKMWLEELPTLEALKRPRYWLGRAEERLVVGEMVKARPWLPSSLDLGIMAKVKEVEKEWTTPF